MTASRRGYLIAMLDGLGMDYCETSNMLEVKKLAAEDVGRRAVSKGPGCLPQRHKCCQRFDLL